MKKVVLLVCMLFFVFNASFVFSQPKVSSQVNYEKIKTLVGYTGEVLAIAFSPDGKIMVIGTSEKKLVIFNASTWETIATLENNDDRVTALAFTRDGKLLAAGDRRDRVYIMDTATWQVAKKFKAYSGVKALAFNHDDSLLAVACGNEKAMLWDVKKGDLAKKLNSSYGDVESIAFSPDGAQVAGGTRDNKVVLWDVVSGNEMKALSGHSSNVLTITYSPDGKYLVSGGADNAIMIWDAKTGKLLNPILLVHSSTICSLAFLPDTNILSSADCKIFLGPFFRRSYVAGTGCKVMFWDAETAKPLKTIDTDCSLSSTAFSPDAKYFVTGNATGPGQFITVYERK